MRKCFSEIKTFSKGDVDMDKPNIDTKIAECKAQIENLNDPKNANAKKLKEMELRNLNEVKEILDNKNNKRIDKLNYIRCYICKEINTHISKRCPKLFCRYCLNNGHNIKTCPNKYFCQFCGSNQHTTLACDKSEFIEKLNNRFLRCALCNNIGHLALDCMKPFYNYKFRYNRFNRNFYYNNYNRYRYQNRYNNYNRNYYNRNYYRNRFNNNNNRYFK